MTFVMVVKKVSTQKIGVIKVKIFTVVSNNEYRVFNSYRNKEVKGIETINYVLV